ncbi:MAG: AAA family ATPase, partial [Candidatus Margulisiibacteriota bacterium]
LDDGRLTDGQGRTIDFKNTAVIMTSNVGSDLILQAKEVSKVKGQILERLKTHFRPEFLNRIDEIIVFTSLAQAELQQIVGLQLGLLKNRLVSKDIAISFTDTLIEHLSQVGYDPVFGARPMKRAIIHEVQDKLALKLLSGDIGAGQMVNVDFSNEGVVFKVQSSGDPKS